MNKRNRVTILTILFSTKLFADLASPTPFIAKQPSGQELSILNRGNHLQGWHEHNGWTVVKKDDGWWFYAKANDGNILIPSNLKVGIDNPEQYPMMLQKKQIRNPSLQELLLIEIDIQYLILFL